MAGQGNILHSAINSFVCCDLTRNGEFLSYANDMFKSGVLTDFKFKIQDREFPVHKLVLASVSTYFSFIFQLAGKDLDCCKLDNIKVEEFRLILDFIYTGSIRLTPSNVQMILLAGKYFNITYLQQQCPQYIRPHLDDENVLTAIGFASDFSLKELKLICLQYFQKRMLAIYRNRIFMQLKAAVLRDVLEYYVLNIGDVVLAQEEIVLKMALVYISENPTDEIIRLLMPVMKFTELDLTRAQAIVTMFLNLRRNNLIKQYVSRACVDGMAVRLDTGMAGGPNYSWEIPRNAADLKFCEVKDRYAVRKDKDVPFPRNFHEANPQMEIEGVSIWIRRVTIYSTAIVGALVVRYRPRLRRPVTEVIHLCEEDENDDMDDEREKSRKFKDDWTVERVQLEPGEYVIGVRVDTDGHFIYGIRFYTDRGRLVGYAGDSRVRHEMEVTPDVQCCRLGAICYDEKSYMGAPVVVNMVLRWVRSAEIFGQ